MLIPVFILTLPHLYNRTGTLRLCLADSWELTLCRNKKHRLTRPHLESDYAFNGERFPEGKFYQKCSEHTGRLGRLLHGLKPRRVPGRGRPRWPAKGKQVVRIRVREKSCSGECQTLGLEKKRQKSDQGSTGRLQAGCVAEVQLLVGLTYTDCTGRVSCPN